MRRLYLLTLLATMLLTGCQMSVPGPRDTRADGFVYLEDGHFALDGKEWFPMMVNYKVDWRRNGDTVWISPAHYYDDPDSWDGDNRWQEHGCLENHLHLMNSVLEANAVRICLDVVNRDERGYFYGSKESPIYLIADSNAIFDAINWMLEPLDGWLELKAMLLLKAPLDEELMEFTHALLRHFADKNCIWAYDFMNEPLYFDPAPTRSKTDAFKFVMQWRQLMEDNAPHQLFTIGFAEPIEVFEWDPSMLPVDFIEMHTYHPLRAACEMYWYGHYCDKPWMVGETALPADNDSVPYGWQTKYMQESYQCAIDNGAIGYGWWEFQDCPIGVNFEAQYTGLLNHSGCIGITGKVNGDEITNSAFCNLDAEPKDTDRWIYIMKQENLKPAALAFATLKHLQRGPATRPENYYNMLGYSNIKLVGKVVDKRTGKPIEGAVVRGWNEDWSVGMNTYTAADGSFALYSNDYCTHFEVSAPGMSHSKFDNTKIDYSPKVDGSELPNRDLEYQQIDYRHYLRDTNAMLQFKEGLFDQYAISGTMKTIKLSALPRN